jgi:hypothetical protein
MGVGVEDVMGSCEPVGIGLAVIAGVCEGIMAVSDGVSDGITWARVGSDSGVHPAMLIAMIISIQPNICLVNVIIPAN